MRMKNVVHFSVRHKREENQDSCFSLQYNGTPDGKGCMSILCVLDGVSNSNGLEAVQKAVPAMQNVLCGLLGKAHVLLEMDLASRKDLICGAMSNAICAAHNQLRSAGYYNRSCGTTVTILTAFDDMVYAANVGDSPAYLLEIPPAGGTPEMTALFQCHNAAGEAVERGEMTPEEARTSSMRNHLMRMVGSEHFLPSDIFTTGVWLGQQSILLLGSDGALAVLPEEELLELMSTYPVDSLEKLTGKLYQRIQESNSTDNFTVVAQGIDTE